MAPELSLSPDHLKISEGLCGPLTEFSCLFLTIVLRCAVNAKVENKEDGTVLNIFHMCLDTSVVRIYIFYYFCFIML